MGSEQSDRYLIPRAIAGDAPARDALWRTHRRWVAAVLVSHAPDLRDVDDLLQEVAMRFVRAIDSLEDPGAFRAWLRAIAVNAARSVARDRARSESRNSGELDANSLVDPRSIPAREPRTDDILDQVARLPADLREPLILKAVHGMSQREVAAAMQLSVEAVESRLARGRRLLRERTRKRETEPQHESANAPWSIRS